MNYAAQDPRHWFEGMSCSICGTTVWPWQEFNYDHGQPVSRGGRRGRINKAFAHVLCNSVKADRFPFSLRTAADREAVRRFITPRTFRRLQRIWAGEPD